MTVSVALFARDDIALEQLAATASIVEDSLTVTVSAPNSYDKIPLTQPLLWLWLLPPPLLLTLFVFFGCRALQTAAKCAWAMVTIKLPALSPGWEPISPRLVAEIGNAADHEPVPEDGQSWPWAAPGLGTVMGDGTAPDGEDINWADLDVGSPGIEIRTESASAPLEFESLSLRASHGGIRLTNVASRLTSADGASAVVAQALAGRIVVDGLSAAADAAAVSDGGARSRLSFWAKGGDAKVSRVRVSVSCPSDTRFRCCVRTMFPLGALLWGRCVCVFSLSLSRALLRCTLFLLSSLNGLLSVLTVQSATL